MFYICSNQYLTKIVAMKRAAILITLFFAAGLLFSACNKQVCPAYSQTETEQTEEPAT